MRHRERKNPYKRQSITPQVSFVRGCRTKRCKQKFKICCRLPLFFTCGLLSVGRITPFSTSCLQIITFLCLLSAGYHFSLFPVCRLSLFSVSCLQVIAAEGEQRASKALKEAADVISQSGTALQLRYLQTLNSIAAERNSTIVFPLPIDFMQALANKKS